MESENIHESVNVNCNVVDDSINNQKVKEPPSINNKSNDVEKESKKVETCTSKVWKYFLKIGVKDGKEKDKCNACGQEYVIGGTKIGTSTLLRHLKKCNVSPKYKDVQGMIIDNMGKLRSRELDQKHVREIMKMAIVKYGLPFKFVEYKWIRELHSYLNPNVKHVSRNTTVSDLWKFHLQMKEKLKLEMHQCHNRIYLTSDCGLHDFENIGKLIYITFQYFLHIIPSFANKLFCF